MTNAEYLKAHGWKCENKPNPFCWREPKTKTLCTESQAVKRQRLKDEEKS